jgi:AcrR family transcriptional regulator
MGISERKEREKQEMREKILLVATEMFIEEGYDKTSIRKIADKIEYSPATIYLYFKDKDEIFHAIHDKGFDKFLL